MLPTIVDHLPEWAAPWTANKDATPDWELWGKV